MNATDPATEYFIDTLITLQALDSREREIALRITKHVTVGNNRRSQVVLADLESGLLHRRDTNETDVGRQSHVVAKFYDPKYAPHKAEWGPSEMCRWAKTNETHAYEKLTELQGISTPVFYGEYVYESLYDEIRPVTVLVLEYISHPLLADQVFLHFTPQELKDLEANAKHMLNKIHGYGVYHNDIELHNIMYGREGKQLILLDWAEAGFDDVNYWCEWDITKLKLGRNELLGQMKRDDDAMLRDVLKQFGLN